jgi:valyl-tRNA synthetase
VNALEGKTLSDISPQLTVKVALEGNVDIAEWLGRSRKRLQEIDKQIAQANGKLNNPGFAAKAPPEVLEEERRRVEDFGAQKERLVAVLAQF